MLKPVLAENAVDLKKKNMLRTFTAMKNKMRQSINKY